MKNRNQYESFFVSQKGVLVRGDLALIVRMAKFPDKWDLPGGRIDKKEDAREAFVREIDEELGFNKFINHGVTHYHIWYLSDGTPYQGICCLIENHDDDIVLSGEHLEYKWIKEAEINNYDYVWPEMDVMIKEGFCKMRRRQGGCK